MSAPAEHGPSEGRARLAGKVGYGSPPEEHRFKKGVSGNPRGRPRRTGTKGEDAWSDLYDVTAAELGRTLKVTVGGKDRRMSVTQAILRNLANEALKGDREASRILLHHQRMLDQDRRRDRRRRFDRQVDYKRRAAADICYSDEKGLQRPKPMPHPDDVHVDYAREEVTILGPANHVERAAWDQAEAERQEIAKQIADLEKVVVGPEAGLKNYQGSREFAADVLREAKGKLAELDARYPSEKQRRQPGYCPVPCRDQNAEGRKRAAIRRTDDVAATAGNERATKQDFQSRLKQGKEALACVNDHIRAFKNPSEASPSSQTDEVDEAEWTKSDTSRKALRQTIRDLRKVLTQSEEELAIAGWSREIVMGHLEYSKRELVEHDAVYPTEAQRRKPGFNLNKWRKQKEGRLRPSLH